MKHQSAISHDFLLSLSLYVLDGWLRRIQSVWYGYGVLENKGSVCSNKCSNIVDELKSQYNRLKY